jgi:hypothetical protein
MAILNSQRERMGQKPIFEARVHFIDLLLKLAEEKYLKNSMAVQTLNEAFDRLCSAVLGHPDTVSLFYNHWRRTRLWTFDCDELFRNNARVLGIVYFVSVRKHPRTGAPLKMRFEEFRELALLLADGVQKLLASEIQEAFLLSVTLSVDDSPP